MKDRVTLHMYIHLTFNYNNTNEIIIVTTYMYNARNLTLSEGNLVYLCMVMVRYGGHEGPHGGVRIRRVTTVPLGIFRGEILRINTWIFSASFGPRSVVLVGFVMLGVVFIGQPPVQTVAYAVYYDFLGTPGH